MLDDLQADTRFASKEELRFLLFSALPLARGQALQDLRRYCASNRYSMTGSLENTLALLEFMGLLSVVDNRVVVDEGRWNPSAIRDQEDYLSGGEFVETLFAALARERRIAEFIAPRGVKRDLQTGLFFVSESAIPLRYFGLRALLITVGALTRGQGLRSGDLLVSERSAKLFEALVGVWTEGKRAQLGRRTSWVNLKERLAEQEERGKQAEAFALAFEQERLRGHPSLECVRRVSEDWANAGFDIESYRDSQSVICDRFVEVKSCAEGGTFYWTRNEVEVARKLGEEYLLYLVDLDRIHEERYTPRMVADPFRLVFIDGIWDKDSETWRIGPVGSDIRGREARCSSRQNPRGEL